MNINVMVLTGIKGIGITFHKDEEEGTKNLLITLFDFTLRIYWEAKDDTKKETTRI